MKQLSPVEIHTNRGSFYIVDIREPYEYVTVNIDTVNIPMGDMCERLSELPSDKTIVLMCQSGNRASALGNLLVVDFEMANVVVMEGGINAWLEQVSQSN